MICQFAQCLKRIVLGTVLVLPASVAHALDVSVPVVPGWNLLGNTGTTAVDAASAAALFDGAKVATLWKWNSQSASWAFYAPSLAAAGTLASYASGKGYQVLASIAPGEGFWVNAAQSFTLDRPGITAYSLGASALAKGWNLVATGDALSPAQLDAKLGGTVAVPSFVTLWAWNSGNSSWYFYAPALFASGSLSGYIQSKGYLDFGALTTENGLGVWLNSNVSGGAGYTPNPLSVSVSQDAGRSVSGVVDVATGGTLSATGVDGTIYTLSVPPGAVLGDETVTLTPLTAITGLPLSGGLSAAVHIAPEGLHLMQPATLQIKLLDAALADAAIGFAFTGSGDEFFLHPQTANGATLSFLLGHFSGSGAGSGTPADRTAMESRQPSSPEDATKQKFESAFAKAKGQGRMPTEEELEPLFRDWYANGVKPDLTAAETDDSKLMCAVRNFAIWDSSLGNALGTSSMTTGNALQIKFAAERDASFASIGKGYKNAFEKSFQRCIANNDPYESDYMLQLAHQADDMRTFGGDYSKFYGGIFDVDVALQKAQKCSRFEVVLDSTIDQIAKQTGQSITYAFKSTGAIVQLDTASPNAPLKSGLVAADESEQYSTTGTTNSYAAQFAVKGLKIILQHAPLMCRTSAAPPRFEVKLDYRVESSGSGTPWWVYYRSNFHSADYVGDYYDYKAADFVKGTGGIVAQKVYSQTYPAGQVTLSEQTQITIKHVPLP